VIKSLTSRVLLAASVLVAVPALASAQQVQLPEQEEVNSWLEEIQGLHVQLEGLQMRALQDPQLQAAQQSLSEDIDAAMKAIDPQFDEKLGRFEALEAEAGSIHEHLMTLQGRVLEQPEIASQVAAYQEAQLPDAERMAAVQALNQALESAMEQLDPQLEERVARLGALEHEAESLQEQLMTVQERALQQPEIAGKIASFQEQMEQKMLEAEPNAQAVIERFRELELKLMQVMGGG
jgi:chromosome segregation ATPase